VYANEDSHSVKKYMECVTKSKSRSPSLCGMMSHKQQQQGVGAVVAFILRFDETLRNV